LAQQPHHTQTRAPAIIVGKAELQFFADFEDFADIVNSSLTEDPYFHPHSPWRLQELPKSELLHLSGHRPTYGRTYAVFHNQERLGEIEVKPDLNYTTQDPRVTAYIELDSVRLLHFEAVRGFFAGIADHVCSNPLERVTLERVQADQQISRAMTSVLWKALKAPQYDFENEPSYEAQIEVELTGSASYYLWRRQYVRDEAAKASQALKA
jgi:hypothetical protein